MTRIDLFQCPVNKNTTEGIEIDGDAFMGALTVFGCRDCSLRKNEQCKGPVKVQQEKKSAIPETPKNDPASTSPEQAVPKRRGRKPKIQEKSIVALTPNYDTSQALPPDETQAPCEDLKPTTEAVPAVGMTDEAVTPLTDEELCRQALAALAMPKHPNYAEIVERFRSEIQAARNVGRSWEVISKVLVKHGYRIGPKPLAREMSKEAYTDGNS